MECFDAFDRASFERPDHAERRKQWWLRDRAYAPLGRIDARCDVCGTAGTFAFPPGDDPNFRESLHCPGCGLISRLRYTLACLAEDGDLSRTTRLYATEQTTPLYFHLRRGGYDVRGSEFVQDPARRAALDDYVARETQGLDTQLHVEDVTALSYADDAFDVVLSFDVLEHVPDYRAALREFRRVLAPGGRLALTVPFDEFRDETLVRASVVEGEVVHHVEPEYHGDPAADAGCLAFYTFGWSLFDDLRAAGFDDVRARVGWSEGSALLGTQFLILAR